MNEMQRNDRVQKSLKCCSTDSSAAVDRPKVLKRLALHLRVSLAFFSFCAFSERLRGRELSHVRELQDLRTGVSS